MSRFVYDVMDRVMGVCMTNTVIFIYLFFDFLFFFF